MLIELLRDYLPVLYLYNIFNYFNLGFELEIYFAFWFLALFPPFWIISFPICWLINYIFVRKAAEKCYYTFDNRKKYNILAIKTTILCFVFDSFISLIMMFIYYYLMVLYFEFLKGELVIMTKNIVVAIAGNPLSNIGAIFIMVIVIFFVKLVQYLVYLHFIVKKLDMDEDKKKKFAFYSVIYTIPYYYFLPSEWFFK